MEAITGIVQEDVPGVPNTRDDGFHPTNWSKAMRNYDTRGKSNCPTDDGSTNAELIADGGQTIPPEQEPEYVGAFSEPVVDHCQHFIGDVDETPQRCGAKATHTVVMWSGKSHFIASCDECGEPDDVEAWDREWSYDRDESAVRADGGTGAVDHDYDAAQRPASERLADQVADMDGRGHDRLQAGDIAIDLVSRQPLYLRERVADTVVDYYDETDFDLATYNQHHYLPVRVTDPVFECVFIGGLDDLHRFSDSYDYPAGRLARVPTELAGDGNV